MLVHVVRFLIGALVLVGVCAATVITMSASGLPAGPALFLVFVISVMCYVIGWVVFERLM